MLILARVFIASEARDIASAAFLMASVAMPKAKASDGAWEGAWDGGREPTWPAMVRKECPRLRPPSGLDGGLCILMGLPVLPL